jgi:hypothetical protein
LWIDDYPDMEFKSHQRWNGGWKWPSHIDPIQNLHKPTSNFCFCDFHEEKLINTANQGSETVFYQLETTHWTTPTNMTICVFQNEYDFCQNVRQRHWIRTRFSLIWNLMLWRPNRDFDSISNTVSLRVISDWMKIRFHSELTKGATSINIDACKIVLSYSQKFGWDSISREKQQDNYLSIILIEETPRE